MKVKFVSSALLTLFVFTSCKKDNPLQDSVIAQNNQLTAKVDGASFQSKTITAVSGSNTGSISIVATDDHDNTVTITGPASVGTFSSASNNVTSGFYTSHDGGLWISSIGDGTATVTITKFDGTAKKVSGSFSFTAPASGGSTATGTKTVTNGSFTDVSFL